MDAAEAALIDWEPLIRWGRAQHRAVLRAHLWLALSRLGALPPLEWVGALEGAAMAHLREIGKVRAWGVLRAARRG